MDGDSKPYMEYLDKEMTIMGILSGFSAAAAALVVEKVAGATSGALAVLFKCQASPLLVGAGAFLLAALFFYLQRSHLAWYYGQIALAQARSGQSPHSTSWWLSRADGWDTWLNYRRAFFALAFGCLQVTVAVAGFWTKTSLPLWLTVYMPMIASIAFLGLQWYVFEHYSFNEEPWSDWLHRRAAQEPVAPD